MVKNRKGQSTLEYVILVTAVIVVIILFLFGANSPLTRGMNDTYNQAGQAMVNMAGRINTAFMSSP